MVALDEDDDVNLAEKYINFFREIDLQNACIFTKFLCEIYCTNKYNFTDFWIYTEPTNLDIMKQNTSTVSIIEFCLE